MFKQEIVVEKEYLDKVKKYLRKVYIPIIKEKVDGTVVSIIVEHHSTEDLMTQMIPILLDGFCLVQPYHKEK